MSHLSKVLVCFAVNQERGLFRRTASGQPLPDTLLTGIGRQAAEAAIAAALSVYRPSAVISSGFAGGLDPKLPTGAVLFQADPGFPLTERLLAAGARRGRFHCAERVVLTAAEKSHLRASTGADAVEMESHWLRECCTPQGVPCATVRVILDTASEDLPLDFNLLCGPAGKLSSRKLTFALGKSPHKIPALIRLGIQTRKASRRLGAVLQATF